tara:strand:- start:1627 stop:2769 length:1143 start_codon:yes stop_codon:yes gene_type:complete
MIIVQFVDNIDTSKLPVDVIQSFKHNTFLLDCQLNEYDHINYITSNFGVYSMQNNNDCAYIDVYERHTTSYTTVLAEDTLAPLIEKLDLLEALKPQILCFSWQMDRNYIVDYRIQKLIEAGNMVVCAGGNQDLPVLDISPVAVEGVIKVGGNKHNGHYQNWIDLYDVTIPNQPNSNKAVHEVCELMSNKRLELDYELGFYSESHVRSAPWPLRLAQTPSNKTKFYEFMPVSNLRYIAGEHLLPSRPGDQVSILSGSIPLRSFVEPRYIDLEDSLPRGITFDPSVGWLYGTFKYKEDMFHRILADINGQLFEYHIISCDADNKPSYEECKKKYFNREYSMPPFDIREYWVPMARPVKLLEPGDPFVRTYNLNDYHLYRGTE